MATHSIFLSGRFHGQSNLGGHSPWGCRQCQTSVSTHTYTGMLLATAAITGGNEKGQGAVKSRRENTKVSTLRTLGRRSPSFCGLFPGPYFPLGMVSLPSCRLIYQIISPHSRVLEGFLEICPVRPFLALASDSLAVALWAGLSWLDSTLGLGVSWVS